MARKKKTKINYEQAYEEAAFLLRYTSNRLKSIHDYPCKWNGLNISLLCKVCQLIEALDNNIFVFEKRMERELNGIDKKM